MNDSALMMFMFVMLGCAGTGLGLLSRRVLYGIMGFAFGLIMWMMNWQLWLYWFPTLPTPAWLFLALGLGNMIMLGYGSIKTLRGNVVDDDDDEF